jgi:hypothetical protein
MFLIDIASKLFRTSVEPALDESESTGLFSNLAVGQRIRCLCRRAADLKPAVTLGWLQRVIQSGYLP